MRPRHRTPARGPFPAPRHGRAAAAGHDRRGGDTPYPGPLAGHVLGMLGARVVRVEPRAATRSAARSHAGDCSARFLALNEGKSVVEADLKTAAGRRTVRDLAREADVFLHNWAPGKAEVFGLDAGTLCAANPALVYAHASGWGPTPDPDPSRARTSWCRPGPAWPGTWRAGTSGPGRR
ncbi:CoA transferase [Streptomyces nogalater]